MRLLAVVLLLSLAGCGYVGPVQPPSPEIPTTINDLRAIERGDKVVISFTTPARTTDGVGIHRFSHIDLRVGPDAQQPESAKSIEVEAPPRGDREDPQPDPISYSLNAADWEGQSLAVVVRTAVKKNGHYSLWSNKAVLNVVAPMAKPVVEVHPSSSGFVLTWPTSGAGQFRVQRQGPADKQPVEIALVNENQYIDVSAEYDTEYRYTVTAIDHGAESLTSLPTLANFPDKYPPTDPTGLTAVAGPDSIDLAWQRNTERDLKGYYVYRSTNNAAPVRISDLIGLPTYSDRKVEHGATYSYKIVAIDKKGNQSGASNNAEAQF